MGQTEARSWISRDYKSFDGLRAVACTMVFVLHYASALGPDTHWAEFLWTGVDVFFVLSGFLITGILIDSAGSPRYFRNFYIRRVLRIFPLYYGFFALLLVLRPVFHLHWNPAVWSDFVYLQNFFMANAAVNNPTLIFIGHLRPAMELGNIWSLCVEEHFYLVWPLIVWRLRNRRDALLAVCLVGIAATMALRTFLYLRDPAYAATTQYLYVATYTRCDTLLIGATLALLLRRYRLTPSRFRAIAWSSLALGVLPIALGLALVVHREPWKNQNSIFSTYGYTFVGIAALGIVMLAIDEASILSRALRFPLLARAGAISYGVYLLHVPPLQFVGRIAIRAQRVHLQGLVVLATFFGVYGLAWLSYRYWESPFLRLKDRFAPPTAHVSKPSGEPLATLTN